MILPAIAGNAPTSLRASNDISATYLAGRRSALSAALLKHPSYQTADWVWVYNTVTSIREGARKGTDGKVVKA